MRKVLQRSITIAAAGVMLSGCGGSATRQPDFRSVQTLPPLVVPPDLVSATNSAAMTLPEPSTAGQPTGEAPAVALPTSAPGPAESSESRRAVLLNEANGRLVLSVKDEYERVWRDVSGSLDELGVKVEGEDRDQGIFSVRYIDPESSQQQGWFKRTFRKNRFGKYRLKLTADGASTTVALLDNKGKPDDSADGEKLLARLLDRLK